MSRYKEDECVAEVESEASLTDARFQVLVALLNADGKLRERLKVYLG